MRISISAGHSARLRPVRHKTSFLRHEWRTNIAAQKVPKATHTSCFAMMFMSFVYSASLSLVRRQTPVLSVMSDMRTQPFFRHRKDNLEVDALYDRRRAFPVMSEVST